MHEKTWIDEMNKQRNNYRKQFHAYNLIQSSTFKYYGVVNY